MKSILLIAVMLSLPFTSFSMSLSSKNKIIKSEEVTYTVNQVPHIGYIASEKSKPGVKKPGVIIVHEWWGHNEYARTRANMLAEKGYVAFAIDMYGNGKKASHPKEAKDFASQTIKNKELVKKKFDEALKILKKRPDVDTDKIVAIGYCFGGGIVLNMALAGTDIDLAASFHGSLSENMQIEKGKTIKPKILVFNGKADSFVTEEQISHFKNLMKNNDVNYEFHNLENAKHSFTNPQADEFAKKFNMPIGYNKKADKKSWNVLLKEIKSL